MSPITVYSTRFGTLEVEPDAAIEFPNGLIGVPGTRYALLAREGDSTFLWLQSLERPEFAVPVVNPWRFFASFSVEISDDEAARIGIEDLDDVDVYVTVRASSEIEDFSANLRAPILVVDGHGHQVINEAGDAPLRASLLGELAAEHAPAA
jgi:flagellar assembly factor FliW